MRSQSPLLWPLSQAELAEQRTIKRRLQHGYREGNAIA